MEAKTSLDCSGNGCCPDAEINSDGTVTLVEGSFRLTLQKLSAEKLASFLLDNGYGAEKG